MNIYIVGYMDFYVEPVCDDGTGPIYDEPHTRFVVAESAGRAKSIFMQDKECDAEFIELRVALLLKNIPEEDGPYEGMVKERSEMDKELWGMEKIIDPFYEKLRRSLCPKKND